MLRAVRRTARLGLLPRPACILDILRVNPQIENADGVVTRRQNNSVLKNSALGDGVHKRFQWIDGSLRQIYVAIKRKTAVPVSNCGALVTKRKRNSCSERTTPQVNGSYEVMYANSSLPGCLKVAVADGIDSVCDAGPQR